jgi:muramidase (phage lysozyme)
MTEATNLPREARAFLDAIAVDESEREAKREGISPYFILVGGGSFERMPDRDGFHGFPEWGGRTFATGISHAAGRYQDQPGTWKGIVSMFPAGATPNFRNPGDQDWGNWFLAQHDFQARTGKQLHAELIAGRIAGMADTMKTTWASLTEETFGPRYHEALARIVATPAPPAPAPMPASTPAEAGTQPSVPAPAPAPVVSPAPAGPDFYDQVLADLQQRRDKLDRAIAAVQEARASFVS